MINNLLMPYNATSASGDPYDPNDPTKKGGSSAVPGAGVSPAQAPTTPAQQKPSVDPAPPQTFAALQAAGVARPPAPNTNPVPNIPAAPTQLPAGYTRDANGVVSFQNEGGAGAGSVTAPIAQKYWDDASQSYKDSTIKPTQTQAQSDALASGQSDPSYQGSIADQLAAWQASMAGKQAIPTYDAQGNLTGTQTYAGGTASGPGLADIQAQNLVNSAPSPQSLQATGSPVESPTGSPAAPVTGPSATGVTTANSPTASGTGGAFDVLNALTQGAQGQGAGSGVQNATQQAILDQLQNPNPYNSDTVKSAYNWLSGNIDDQYALQQKQLAQDMARRGLGASSIYAGNLNDLNIGKRSAQETLAQDLAQQLASSQGQYQANAISQGLQGGTSAQQNNQSWLQQLMGYGQQAFNNDQTTNAANQTAQNNWQNYILQLLGMGYSPTG